MRATAENCSERCSMDSPSEVETTVEHSQIAIDGMQIFFREAGRRGAPALLLPHGYPCSSYQFRSSQIGLRLALRAPSRVTALIIQNGDIYADAFGPKYRPLLRHFAQPTSESRQELAQAVSEEGFRDEFLNDVRDELKRRISPDLWKLAWSQLNDPGRREIMVRLMEGLKENLEWFPRYQAYLREHRPPALIVWGPQDGYMPEGAARAYLRDLPDAELHLVDGGHWALETNFDEVVARVRDFLERRSL